MSLFKVDLEKLTCGECKHACYYPCSWWYPFKDPLCEVTKRVISPDDFACEHFVGGGMRAMMVIVKFRQEYYDLIVNGSKTQTMRLPAKRIDVNPGEKIIAVFPEGEELLLRITDVGYKYFRSINDDDAKLEGFSSADELKKELTEIYSQYHIDEHNRFYYYRFEHLSKR